MKNNYLKTTLSSNFKFTLSDHSVWANLYKKRERIVIFRFGANAGVDELFLKWKTKA